MEVLHINNPAKVAWNIANAQKTFGLKAHVVVTSKSGWNECYDYDLSNINTKTAKGKLILGKSLISYVKKADIIHYHGAPISKKYKDLILWRKILGKPTVIHHHGTEVRFKPYPILAEKLSQYRCVSTPDLLKYVPRGIWIPNPVDMHTLPYTGLQSTNKPVIIHAPSNRKIKNSAAVIKAIELLKSKGIKFVFKLIEGQSYETLINEMKKADIIIDWVNPDYGIYGVLSLEALALGKIAICTLNNQNYKGIDLPIVSVLPDNLAEKIEFLIENKQYCRRLSEKGRKFVVEHHHPLKIGVKILKIYKNLLNI